MIEGVIRLNRFGFERRKLWPAALLAIAVFAPIITWVSANSMVSGEEELPEGQPIVLTAAPPPMAPPGVGVVGLEIPGKGWSIETSGSAGNEVTLVHNSMTVNVTAVAGVKQIKLLFKRQKRELADYKSGLFVTDTKPYTTRDDLKGLWGELTGERYGGALVVVGQGSAAAVVTVTAPLGRLDGEVDDLDDMLDSLEVST